jgi:hypothetical protein
MPVHHFAVKWDDDQAPDVRYTHLADEEAARRYAKLLIHKACIERLLFLASLSFRGEGRERTAILNAIPRNCCLTAKLQNA